MWLNNLETMLKKKRGIFSQPLEIQASDLCGGDKTERKELEICYNNQFLSCKLYNKLASKSPNYTNSLTGYKSKK